MPHPLPSPPPRTARLAAAVTFCLGTLASASAHAHDYPTVDRIEFVHRCQLENSERPAQEMLYKCACVVDRIADQLTYEQFVDGSTAFYASSIAGERGAVIRNEKASSQLADAFRGILGQARKACLVSG